jgi:hypothetical protein
VPWCDNCSRFQPPNTLTETGGCPDCETVIGKPAHTPWHFKLMILAVAIYLGWRAWQGIEWLAGKL